MHKDKNILTGFSWTYVLTRRWQTVELLPKRLGVLGPNPASTSFETSYYFLPHGNKDIYVPGIDVDWITCYIFEHNSETSLCCGNTSLLYEYININYWIFFAKVISCHGTPVIPCCPQGTTVLGMMWRTPWGKKLWARWHGTLPVVKSPVLPSSPPVVAPDTPVVPD